MKLNDLSIRTKVLMMIFVPIMALLCAMAYIINTEKNIFQENDELYELVSTAPDIGNFLQELQKERALSVQFVNAPQENKAASYDRLKKQRLMTDSFVPNYQNK